VSLDNNLREQLSDVFSAIDPAAAPVEAAIRQGKRLRWRRRATAATGLAAVVAAAICVPLAVHPLASPPPATSQAKYSVTVQPPGPGSPAGEIAQGSINGASWRVTADKPIQENGQPVVCIHLSGPLFRSAPPTMACNPALTNGAPAGFEGTGVGPVQLLWAPVESDVSYATVALTNGEVLTLRPVTLHGTRWIAFAVLDHVVRSVTAYSSRGEISTVVPFDKYTGYSFVTWLKPGQHGPAPATAVIGSGTADGKPWSVTLYAGSWGICETTSNGTSTCWDNRLDGAPFAGVDGSVDPGALHIVTGSARLDVARIVISLPGGQTAQVQLVAVDGVKYWAFGYPKAGLHWTAYDAAGTAVAHGTT
jgi:hypothetical protein